MQLADEFKTFLLRGNVLELAVAFVIGAAFTTVVTSLVDNLLMPVIAMLFGEPDFSALDFTINDAVFGYGSFITAVVSFVLIAAAVFFFVVKPANLLMQRMRTEPSPDPTTRKCPECLSEIPIAARRCAFCTAEVAPA
ncbi:MAG: large conductance mechanosensitive channel protein MscL [Dehalococcoidia bacterium]|nr:large conductance mechanosensitive channel protein MscL [Dehalococcoidia bacterium]MCA9844829.1 large conductance mechanosensitive channel protein MscL [Dehalococcoidia bacterium]MCA9854101.1 large conductance mechanosensitive channel protein MscL [Dehalococcoidia bacterium]